MEEQKGPKKTVLMVDQGLSFGGALIVLLSIARNLPDDYRPVVVSAIKGDLDSWVDTKGIVTHSCIPSFTYIGRFKWSKRISAMPSRFLRRVLNLFLSMFEIVLNMGYIFNIYKIIKSQNVDVVHANNSIYALIAASIARKPCVWHIHGVVTSNPSFLHKLLSYNVTKYIAISRLVAESAIAHDYSQKKIDVLHNPVADQFLLDGPSCEQKLRARFGIVKGDFVIAIFGRVIKWKGQRELVKAFIHAGFDKNVKLMLVGDSSEGFADTYLDNIKQIAQDHDVGDQLLYTGFIKNVHQIYDIVDVAVHASIEPEPFGLVVIEAMASAVPVIASNLGAPSEVITDGVNGLLVDPNDNDGFAFALKRVVTNHRLRSSLTEQGSLTIRDRFLPSNYANKLAEIYQESIEASVK